MTRTEAREFLRDLRSFIGEAMDAVLDAINETDDEELADLHREALASLEEAEGAISDAIGRYRES